MDWNRINPGEARCFRTMPNYSDGKIYAIRSHQTDKVYIGSTTQSISKRFYEHKKSYERYLKDQKKAYISSFEMFKYDDCYIELIETCKSKEELLREEGILIREMNCVNRKIEGRSNKDYYKENKAKYNEYMKAYYRNPEKKENQKEWASEVIICNTCNTEMIKNSWSQHCKSIKHLGRIAAPPLEQEEQKNNESDEPGGAGCSMQRCSGWRPKVVRNRVKPIMKVTYSNEDWFHCIFCNEVKEKNTSEGTVEVKKGLKMIQIKICETCLIEQTLARPGVV
jgi:hypothetical protein